MTEKDLANQTALITGGTDGIGKEVAFGLARTGMRVIIVGRDNKKGIQSVRHIQDQTHNHNVHFLRADLSLMHDAARLATDLASRSRSLHLLVHCAGMVRGCHTLTAEGIESNFAVNYLSRFLLTERLLPLLKVGAQPGQSSRILVISGAAQGGRIYFDDVSLTTNFMTLRAVRQSCQANDVFTMELARRLASHGENHPVTVTCLKIGAVKTGIRREFPLWMKLLVPVIVDPILAITPQQAAEPALKLLLSNEFEGVTGALFLNIRAFKRLKPDKTVLDPKEGGMLWHLSQEIIEKLAAPQSNASDPLQLSN
jgi:NAD(P)-dependent dehydrogenase (short-subunit alcohol dehydrogenase family)